MVERFIAQLHLPGQQVGSHEVVVSDGVIEQLELVDKQTDLHLLPGLADVHNHGAVGESFPNSDVQGCIAAARYHQAHGTTTLLASTVSLPADTLLRQLDVLADVADQGVIDGIHAEGPFINACRCGAQDPTAIIPGDPHLLQRMIDAARGHLRAITFAPETAHAREMVELCAQHNVIVSLGHTDADATVTAELIDFAVATGATVTATHLFNAMPPLHHRDPGAVAALLTAAGAGQAVVELVADGVHLDDATVDMVLGSVGADRASFVSDAMAAAGKADGDYVLGALDVTVAGGVARLSTTDGSDGAIAGGTSTVFEQLARRVRRGSAISAALPAVTSGHLLLGREDRTRLSVGDAANLIVCDNDFTILHAYRDGQKVV